MAGARIRSARADEALVLEALQRRSSDAWESDQAHLAAHPDAIAPPHEAIARGLVRVATDESGLVVGFATTLTPVHGSAELDDLFVEPAAMGTGIGRSLVEDAAERSRAAGATRLEVIANPNALGFYERLGFAVTGTAQTRFAVAPRMTRTL